MPARAFVALPALAEPRRADAWPVALGDGEVRDWAQFSQRWRARAWEIATRPEQRFLIACEDSFAFAADLFAVLYLGRTAILPPNSLPGTLAEAAAWCEASLGVVVPARPRLALEPQGEGALAAANFPQARVELYTSGSSGAPKRAIKTVAQLADEVAMLEALWGERIGEASVVATVPHHHIYGLLFRVLWPLCAGRPFGMQTLADPVSLQAAVMASSRSVLISSPAHLERLPALADLGAWKAKLAGIFSSGGPLSAANARAIREAVGRAPTEVLGSTETGGIAWRERHGGRDDEAWTPLPGVSLRIDAERALHVSSPYAGITELATGDAASWLADGRMQLLGRIDRVAKMEGKRVSLEEMETRLRQHPWVRDARVAPLPDRAQRLGAIVVLDAPGGKALAEGSRADLAVALRAHLAQYFDAVLLPRRWRFLDALPFDERGKITAAAVAEILGGREDEHAS